MSPLGPKNGHHVFAMIAAVSSMILLLGYAQVAGAGGPGPGPGPGYHRPPYMDSRFGHNRYYPPRGQYIEVLPGGYRAVSYRNTPYYFYGGAWYRPWGRSFVIASPPFGMIVPFLPPYYSTIWVGGIPYYYANEVFYTSAVGGYVIVEAPKGEVIASPPPAGQTSPEQLFIYPRQGQSEEQQATDRYECHRWAVNQTGYDPVQPPAGLSAPQLSQKRGDYQRAMGACLEGRGYTVK